LTSSLGCGLPLSRYWCVKTWASKREKVRAKLPWPGKDPVHNPEEALAAGGLLCQPFALRLRV